MVSMLTEVETFTLNVFNSFLLYISGSNSQLKPRGWSVVSQLMHHKIVARKDEENDGNEIAKVDGVLQSLYGHRMSKYDNSMLVEHVQGQLKNLELCIQDLEEGLECIYRKLIRTRVSFINVANH